MTDNQPAEQSGLWIKVLSGLWKKSLQYFLDARLGVVIAFGAFFGVLLVIRYLHEPSHRRYVTWISPTGIHLVDFAAINLAICGIIYAIIQQADAAKQHRESNEEFKKLTDVTDRLEEIKVALSTVRVGQFPEYLKQIEELSGTAEHLNILIDCLDYGSFFLPPAHLAAHDQLCRTTNKPVVRLLVCGAFPEPLNVAPGVLPQVSEVTRYHQVLHADEHFMEFLAKLTEWDKLNAFHRYWFREDLNINRTHHLAESLEILRNQSSSIPIQDNVAASKGVIRIHPTLDTILQVRQLYFARLLHDCRNITVLALDEPESVFFWLKGNPDSEDIDGSDKALFTFAHAARGKGQCGFQTRDTDLLKAFRAIFNSKWKRAEDLKKEGKEPNWISILRGL
jgi:hypothetical protein